MRAKGNGWTGVLAVALLAGLAAQAQAQAQTQTQTQSVHPADRWEYAIEAGYLTKVKHNSPFGYQIAPFHLAWRSPATNDLWRSESGARLTLRHRFSIVAEAITHAPETHYYALAAAPVFELWAPDRKTAGFFEIGGGVGWLDSKHVPGGQGQNMAFNWYTQGGLRRQISNDFALTAAVYFTHHSNLGMTNPNPGIDVLGLNFGAVWAFK